MNTLELKELSLLYLQLAPNSCENKRVDIEPTPQMFKEYIYILVWKNEVQTFSYFKSNDEFVIHQTK